MSKNINKNNFWYMHMRFCLSIIIWLLNSVFSSIAFSFKNINHNQMIFPTLLFMSFMPVLIVIIMQFVSVYYSIRQIKIIKKSNIIELRNKINQASHQKILFIFLNFMTFLSFLYYIAIFSLIAITFSWLKINLISWTIILTVNLIELILFIGFWLTIYFQKIKLIKQMSIVMENKINPLEIRWKKYNKEQEVLN